MGGIGLPRALSDARAESSERLDANESADAAEAAEPIEKREHAEPIEPIDRTDPTEPIERIDPSLAIDRIDPFDVGERRDGMPEMYAVEAASALAATTPEVVRSRRGGAQTRHVVADGHGQLLERLRASDRP
jgi:hypothetical protein